MEGEFFTEYIKKGTSFLLVGFSVQIRFYCCSFSCSFPGSKTHLNITIGDVLMLSEGRMGIDNVYSLREGTWLHSKPWKVFHIHVKCLSGILTLYLNKESYERAGLVGKPDGVKGKRGTRSRWGNVIPENPGFMRIGANNLPSGRDQPPSSINATWEEGI